MTTTHDVEPTPICMRCGEQTAPAAGGYRCPSCGTTSGRPR